MPPALKLKLTRAERHISIALAGLFATRMLGLFLLLPVFAVAARALPGGDNPTKVGLALGMYGLTQAFFQIPLGLASDRWGRRPVVLLGLALFIGGSIVCALSSNLFWITVGRAIQGAGAISSAITAWVADATRDAVRTRAMAIVGASIGVSFAISLILAPLLVGSWGLSGLFWSITGLGIVSFVVARWGIPETPPGRHLQRAMQGACARQVLLHADLWRLNVGVFCLHAIQIALFVMVPTLLIHLRGLAIQDLWQVYLPVILVSFVFMVPVIFWAEKYHAHRAVLRGAVASLVLVLGLMAWGQHNFGVMMALLISFFVMFNVLEALQPALVSRVAPGAYKGLALGFYNTAQAGGLFFGGAISGVLATQGGPTAVFLGVAALALIWLLSAWGMKPFIAP